MPRHNVREQLVDAGLHTLYRQGFNGSGVQDITAAAGVPKGSFYNHFESKEAFALEVLERFWLSGDNRRSLLADTQTDPVERLRRHFKALSDAVVRYDVHAGCLIGNFSTELSGQSEPVRDRLIRIYADWTKGVEACVQEAADAGSLRAGLSPGDVAAFLINAWEGAVMRAKVERSRLPLDQMNSVAFAALFS